MKYAVVCKTSEEFKCVANHYNWTLFHQPRIDKWATNFVIYITDGKPSGWDEAKYNAHPEVSFNIWSLVTGVKLKPNKTLELTNDYDATIDYTAEVIIVGCQSISFSKVEELVKLIK